jgi:hypothetical protein
MLGGARELRYDWILLRPRDLPHEAGVRPPSCSPRMRRGGSLRISPSSIVRQLHINSRDPSRVIAQAWNKQHLLAADTTPSLFEEGNSLCSGHPLSNRRSLACTRPAHCHYSRTNNCRIRSGVEPQRNYRGDGDSEPGREKLLVRLTPS